MKEKKKKIFQMKKKWEKEVNENEMEKKEGKKTVKIHRKIHEKKKKI